MSDITTEEREVLAIVDQWLVDNGETPGPAIDDDEVEVSIDDILADFEDNPFA